MKVIEFIKENKNWKEILSDKPFCLSIKEYSGSDDAFKDLIVFSYNQIESDFSQPIVQECRGLILEKDSWQIVCRAFDKFFNYGEVNAAKLNVEKMFVTQKVDGSIMKLYYYNGFWRIATNGTINALETPLQNVSSPFKTFGELFLSCLKDKKEVAKLNRDFTYIFEMCSPWNRVVVPFDKPTLFYLGKRNNKTGEEIGFWKDVDTAIKIKVNCPEMFFFNSLDVALKNAQKLPFNEEGYVACDDNYNRVKIKSPAYLVCHRLKNNGVLTKERAWDLITINEYEEYLSYFKEDKDFFDKGISIFVDVKNILTNLKEKIEKEKNSFSSKKDFALFVKEKELMLQSFYFAVWDGKVNTEQFTKFVNKVGIQIWEKELDIKLINLF